MKAWLLTIHSASRVLQPQAKPGITPAHLHPQVLVDDGLATAFIDLDEGRIDFSTALEEQVRACGRGW